MTECIFCKIVKGELGTKFVHESDNFVVFADIHPSAPLHFLIVPKSHFESMLDLPDILWIEVKSIAEALQKQENLLGFRLATNVGDTAVVKHMHVHFLGGIKKDRKV
jgi:histidine triad (HIT) family protein